MTTMPIPVAPIADVSSQFRDWAKSMLLKPVSDEVNDPYDTVRTARGMIRKFHELRECSQNYGVEFRVTELSDDAPEVEEESNLDRAPGADQMLELIRDTRNVLVGAFSGPFIAELTKVNRVLAGEFETKLNEVLPLFEDLEKYLIVLGAGTDEDAASIMDLIPTADDLGFTA